MAPRYDFRWRMLPGLTGLAQVSEARSGRLSLVWIVVMWRVGACRSTYAWWRFPLRSPRGGRNACGGFWFD